MKIRKATKEDFDVLCKLRREFLTQECRIPDENDEKKLKSSDELIKTYFTRDYSTFFLAIVDEKAVGFIHGTIDPKPQEHIQAYVQDLFVEKEYRGQGIGNALFNELQAFFKDNNVKAGLTTEVTNQGTIEFYKKRGYEIYKTEADVVYMIQSYK